MIDIQGQVGWLHLQSQQLTAGPEGYLTEEDLFSKAYFNSSEIEIISLKRNWLDRGLI